MCAVAGDGREASRDGSVLLEVGREALFPLERALGREWLEVDGLGGYACSTVVLCPTRRQHGLLVARPPGNPRRHVFLSRYEEVLHRPEREFPLSTGRYPNTWHPTGHAALHRFALAPHPVFTYRVGRTTVTREVLLVRGRSAVLVRYGLESEREDIELRLRPLVPFREADALTFENLHLDPRVERVGRAVVVRPYRALPLLAFRVAGASAVFEVDPVWYRRVEYPRDLERGHEGHEDNFNPGWFSVPLPPGRTVVVSASLGEAIEDPEALFEEELARRRAEIADRPPGLAGQLAVAARIFPVRTPAGRFAIAAGYPWPAESARDTLIALPGLLGGDPPAFARVLEGLVPFLKDGLLPTRVGRTPDDSAYEGVDPSLWFAWSLRALEKTGADIAPFVPALFEIATRYEAGTALEIRVDEEGLLHAGREDLAVTWMDARVDGRPVTPRHGYAVEVNALWYQLLAWLERLAPGRESRRYRALRRRARRAFLDRFWLASEARLADVWRDGRADDAVRPNMLIAAALERSPLTRGQRTDVVACVRAELMTPVGIRTLAPKNAAYRGHAGARGEEREAALHQGSAWPWLLGFFAEAWGRAHGLGPKRALPLVQHLEGLDTMLEDGGMLQVPEVADGDPPHRAGGAVARAISVAEPRRAFALLERGRP